MKTITDIFGEITEVLYEFDGSRIFTTTRNGLIFLAYQYDENLITGLCQFIVTPITREQISFLKCHVCDVNSVFHGELLFLVDIDRTGYITHYNITSFHHLDKEILPKPGICLYY